MADKHFDLSVAYTSQTEEARQIVLDEVSRLLLVKILIYIYIPQAAEKYPVLKQYRDNWVTKDILFLILKKTIQNHGRPRITVDTNES